MKPTTRDRIVYITASVSIGGWLTIFALLLWWHLLQPVNVPTIDQPIPVLNENREIAVGESIVLQLDVVKTDGSHPTVTNRFIVCESGNLITLTPSTRDLPVGEYRIISDSVDLPAKVTVGDTCTFLYRVDFRINPVRTVDVEYESEPFTVVQRGEAGADAPLLGPRRAVETGSPPSV